MEDRELMERELLLMKGISTLYLHGSIESETKEVHEAFKCALEESLNIENHIYNLMKDRGWYQTDEADMNKISIAKQKFSQN